MAPAQMGSKVLFFSTTTTLGPLLAVAILTGGLAIAWLTQGYPLNAVHWDSPIYLLRGKTYAEGGYLQQFRTQAIEIHQGLMGNPPTPGDFWSFARLGNTVLLGTLVEIAGTDEQSIYIITWMYRIFFASGVFFSALLAAELVTLFYPASSSRILWFGILASLTVYLLSPIAGYMSGNLVSEVPAILLLSMACWALARAVRHRSTRYAFAAGILAFLLYVVRIETIWIFAAFFAALFFFYLRDRTTTPTWWPGFLTTAGIATLLFSLYSAAFFPLTDPRVLPRYVEAVAAIHNVAPTFARSPGSAVFAASGLLWVGAFFSLLGMRTNKAAQLAVVWLMLTLLPAIPAFSSDSRVQVRAFTTFLPVVFLLSAIGWSRMFLPNQHVQRKLLISAAVTICIVLVLIGQPSTYTFLRDLPGMWRLQYLRAYLAPPAFEQVDYYLPELIEITKAIDSVEPPSVLIASPAMQRADHVMIIQYLSETQARNVDQIKDPKGLSAKPELPEYSIHLARFDDEPEKLFEALPIGTRVLLLSMREEEQWAKKPSCYGKVTSTFFTPHFAFAILVLGSSS